MSTVWATVDFVADLSPVSATVDFVASVYRAYVVSRWLVVGWLSVRWLFVSVDNSLSVLTNLSESVDHWLHQKHASHSFVVNAFQDLCMTAYSVLLIFFDCQQQVLKKIGRYIQEQNNTIYIPRGLLLVDPIERGLRVVSFVDCGDLVIWKLADNVSVDEVSCSIWQES